MKGLVEAYRALSEIYLKGSWIGEAVNTPVLLENKGAYRLVYGVVEHDYLYEYRIRRFAEKSPKPAVKILLKMGMFLLDNSSCPAPAAVNAIAETAKQVGKGGVTGFLNATLRRYASEGRKLYPADRDELLSVRANLPVWLVRRYRRELGDEAAAKRLTAPLSVKTHVRASRSFGQKALGEALREREIPFSETAYGYYVGAVGGIADLIKEGKATVMSWSSIDVCAAISHSHGKILDLCAAPGGKSVFLAEKFGASVIACDLYPHRVELIRKYAARMGVTSVDAMVWDGRTLREEWREAFPTVLLDAPCSGLGSLASNPDIALHRTEEGLQEIVALQTRLIAVAAEYVAPGGTLVYATCSDLPSEDGEIVSAFLRKASAFTLEEEKYTDPKAGGGESYYYAILRKK